MEINNLNPSSSSSRAADRKLVERNRRTQMKALYSKLNSLVTHPTSREGISVPDQLEEATNYIKKLQMRLEKLKDKKNTLLGIDQRPNNGGNNNTFGIRSPQIEIHQIGLAFEILLITGLDCQFMLFNQAIRVLQEEGADIVSAGYTAAEDSVFHTIHCQLVGESGNVGARISERLRKLMYDHSS